MSHPTSVPLNRQSVTADECAELRVFDGEGREYHRSRGESADFVVSGALGTHVITAHDAEGREVDRARFTVDCRSEISDAGDRFGRLFRILHYLLESHFARPKMRFFDGEEVYRNQCITSRGTYTAGQGGRYFYESFKDSPTLFARYQKENGMIWDFGMPVAQDARYHFEWRWGPEFSRRVYNNAMIFARQPVMNDVEHQFINGIYLAWQVSGDDAWMAGMMDSALGAVAYTRTSPYTWSEQFQLIHRPYCLDLWDFQSTFDAALVGGDEMHAVPGVSKFGVFYGDNLCMAHACRNLALMLEHCRRHSEAADMRSFADGLIERTNALCWNGAFYRHHVSEDPSFVRDFGIDETRVISLSNSIVANVDIGHEKARAIIDTYQRLRKEMPADCPAEFVTMYPAHPRGFHIVPWAYVNGACAGLVAGELARAAFEHGCETYAVDVLHRYQDLFEPYAPDIEGGMWGKTPSPPERSFTCLDLRLAANADLRCDAARDGWGGQPGNDMRALPTGRADFQGIPIDVIDPQTNGGRACVRLASDVPGFARAIEIAVDADARSIYFLHGVQGGGTVAGELQVTFEDGTAHRQYVITGRHVQNTWNPGEVREKRKIPQMMTAWTGGTEVFDNVGLSIWGWANPHPAKRIRSITLRASLDASRWLIVGLTASDADVWLPPKPTFEGPNQYWSAACVTRALGEGLAGVVDTDRNMRAVRITPRWAAAGIDQATVCLKYEDGGGYVRYRYERAGRAMRLSIAGNSDSRRVEVLLPADVSVQSVRVNGERASFGVRVVDTSRYACFALTGLDAKMVTIEGERTAWPPTDAAAP